MQVVAAADMPAVDEDLRHAGAADDTGHGRAQVGLAVDADLLPVADAARAS